VSLLPYLADDEARALLHAAHHLNAFPSAHEALRLRRLAWCDKALAENARHHTEDEIQRAIERAQQDARDEGRREPTQHELTLAA
jgi:hypothetical protein